MGAPKPEFVTPDAFQSIWPESPTLAGILAALESVNESVMPAPVADRLHQPFDLPRVFDYIRYLLLHKEADEAKVVWREAASLLGLNAYLPSSNNLIVNGDFSLDVLNGGFDWQYRKQPSVSLTLDTSDFHAGHRSLSIGFDGPGVDEAGIYQIVAVQPNTTYEFSAYYKNGEIEGAGAACAQSSIKLLLFVPSFSISESLLLPG